MLHSDILRNLQAVCHVYGDSVLSCVHPPRMAVHGTSQIYYLNNTNNNVIIERLTDITFHIYHLNNTNNSVIIENLTKVSSQIYHLNNANYNVIIEVN
jgi:phenylpyruvate tautomerase PptA (4-oxalocrotonate tautomerase family)